MRHNGTARPARIGTLTGRQLAALLEALAPYRGEPISAPVIELATRLARLEAIS